MADNSEFSESSEYSENSEVNRDSHKSRGLRRVAQPPGYFGSGSRDYSHSMVDGGFEDMS